jgi:hypothetical protein
VENRTRGVNGSAPTTAYARIALRSKQFEQAFSARVAELVSAIHPEDLLEE